MGRQALLVDTHAHLDASAFEGERDAIVRRALDAGVGLILAVGTDLNTSRFAVEMAERFPSVYAAVGVHPHEAERFESEAEEVHGLLSARKVIAVGEIGLDYYRPGAARELQLEVFQEQLRWATEARLPVSVHNRQADSDLLQMVANHSAPVVLHCFSGSLEYAGEALAAGCYLSFAGNITFPRADALRDVLSSVPDGRLLLETDSPVLAPQPHRGRRNEPAFIVETARTAAAVRDVSVKVLSDRTTANADLLFDWGQA